MINKYILDAEYDFTSEDLETPDMKVQELCDELSKVTEDFVQGYISEYDGEIESYSITGRMTDMTRAIISSYGETDVRVQDSLGAIGELEFKYEFYIDNFKFRVFNCI